MIEPEQQQVVDKFKPWFPAFRDIPAPTEPCPEMSPREALLIIEADLTYLYNGGSGVGAMRDKALNVLWQLAGDHA